LGVEVAAEWPVFGAMAVALAAYYVPDWSEAADRFLTHSLARDLLGFELIALVVLLVVWTLQRLVRPGAIRHRVRRQWRVALAHVRRAPWWRSEEHTSELQSRGHLVCRLLLEKKK